MKMCDRFSAIKKRVSRQLRLGVPGGFPVLVPQAGGVAGPEWVETFTRPRLCAVVARGHMRVNEVKIVHNR